MAAKSAHEVFEKYTRDLRAYIAGGLFENVPSGDAGHEPIRTGDVLLRLPAMEESLAIASVMLSGYSHCGIAVEERGRIFVADCHPSGSGEGGNTRFIPFETWSREESGTSMVHWLALRHTALDVSSCARAVDDISKTTRFGLMADHFGRVGEPGKGTGNCTSFLLAILARMGLDCTDVEALGRVNQHTFLTFLKIMEAGFYDLIREQGARRFMNIAREYGITGMLGWKGVMLPPAFAEMLPGFKVVAYQRPSGKHQDHFAPWLEHYRRTITALRAAASCHGIAPAQVPVELVKASGSLFGRVLAGEPRECPLDGVRLASRILMAESSDPSNYIRIPIGARHALNGQGATQRLCSQAMILATPAVLHAARLLGWKPIKVFDACAKEGL
ncbi:MAG: hypothetical protein HY795_15555 [Desulfovibrio sp.]|nr:hypothetical protein [Desulfovibrio sp.]MBI4958761.1 hypothetical protein [Desulfovibrio sp.]